MASLVHGDPDRAGIIRQSAKQVMAGILPNASRQ
jgi:hypothetical protein